MSSNMWQMLSQHQQSLSGVRLKDLFSANPTRFKDFSLSFNEILFDYSKQRVTQETIQMLCALANEKQLQEAIEALFSGKIVNSSEQRSALHMALRDLSDKPLVYEGADIKPKIKAVLKRMERLVEEIHNRKYLGVTGKPIIDIVSLGIGGSDLGPAMVCQALQSYKIADVNIHFISNVDGKTLDSILKKINPETTLCIINSKTFTTPETLLNAKTLKHWFQKKSGQNVSQHLVAVTANIDKALSFGISEQNIFEFWDFVGGRYSVWSAVGLPIALLLGMDNFKSFLAGAYAMDQHFYTASFEKNMPVLLALLGIWNINFWNNKTLAIIPYDDGLQRFPDYLQQLEMESNGKTARRQEGFVSYSTAPVIWGGVGCNGQHAYMQLLHQGSEVIPIDFLIAAQGHPDYKEQHKLLMASCLSQSKALMEGTYTFELPQDPIQQAKFYAGNRPSNTIIYSKLDPKTLGSLIALYEHKVFTQGVLWDINSFDQWGVELGKKMVNTILPILEDGSSIDSLDSSTTGLIQFAQQNTMLKA